MLTTARRLAHLLLGAALLAYQINAAAAGGMRVDIGHTEPWGYYPSTTERTTTTRQSAPVGIIADITATLAKESGIATESLLTPLPKIWKNLKTGETDLSFLIRSEDRDNDVIYIAYLFPLDTILLARPGTTLRSYDDLAPLRIGVLRDIRLSHQFDHDSTLRKFEFRDYEAMVDTLLANRIDAIAGNSVSLEFLLNKRGLTQVSQWPRLLLQKNQVWAQMSKRSPYQQHSLKIRNTIDRLRNQGFFEQVIGRYTNHQGQNSE